jgi:hypothetical protein
MSISKLQASVTTALQHAKGYAEAIAEATKAGKGMARDEVRTAILPTVAAFYGVKVKAGEGKAEGTQVMDSEAAKYEAARKALSRLLGDICGEVQSSPRREPVVAPRKVFKSVLSEIINSGMTKAEFNALLAELRDSVSFE